jgi:hypothetical protein
MRHREKQAQASGCRHIAIKATAIMLQSWFEEEKPTPEKAKQMVSAVMDALLTVPPASWRSPGDPEKCVRGGCNAVLRSRRLLPDGKLAYHKLT